MIELASTVLLLVSAFSPEKATAETLVGPVVNSAESTIVETANAEHPGTLSDYVAKRFKDNPILAEIARCESSTRQYDKNGNVLRGIVNKSDIGLMQINTYYHGEKAKELGYDLYTIDGNLDFGEWLYNKYGDNPWVSSSKCWKVKSPKVAVK